MKSEKRKIPVEGGQGSASGKPLAPCQQKAGKLKPCCRRAFLPCPIMYMAHQNQSTVKDSQLKHYKTLQAPLTNLLGFALHHFRTVNMCFVARVSEKQFSIG